MRKVMVTGASTNSCAALMIIGLTASLLAIPFVAWGGGGSGKSAHLPPAYGLPDSARADTAIWALPSSRLHSAAQPGSGSHWQRRSGDHYRNSIANWAQWINKLAKDLSPRGRRELATAVDQLPKDQSFYDAAPKDLALLTNGISKLLDGQGDPSAATGVLNTLAREVCRRDLGDRQWQPQTLAMVVSGFSKGVGEDITRALRAVAKVVTDRKQELGLWPERQLAMVVSGLGKGEGAEIADALNVLAQAITERKQALSQWTELHLTTVISGLSKGEGAKIAGALNVLAQAVTERKQELSQWTEPHLAMVVSGLRKGEGGEIAGALGVLAKVVTERKHELSQWKEQHLAMVVNGLSKGEGAEIVDTLGMLAKVVTERKQELSHWKALHLAMVVSGLSKGEGGEIAGALGVLAQTVIDRQGALGQWTKQHLVMAISGFGKGEGAEITGALNVLAQAVTGRKQELSQWQEPHLAMVINGLSKGEGVEIAEARNVLAQAVTERKQELSQWQEPHLAMVINGLSKGTGEEITKALDMLAEVVAGQVQQLDQWHQQHLAMVVNGLSNGTGENIARALNAFAQIATAGKLRLAQWTERPMAMVISGLSKGTGEEITRGLSVFAQAVLDQGQGLNQWAAPHLAMVVQGLSRGTGDDITRALDALARLVIQRKQQLKHWTELDLAMVAGGLRKVRGGEITHCLQTLILEITGRDLSQWQPQGLAAAVNSMGQISQNPVFGKLITELASRAGQKPLWLLITLKKLCRLQLSREQVDAALSLLEALHRSGYRPDRQEAQEELLWYLTLVHFSNQQLLAVSSASHNSSDQLAQLYRHYVETGGDSRESAPVVAAKPDNPVPDEEQGLGSKRWRSLFARDYWQGEHRQWRGGTLSPPTVLPAEVGALVSQLQTQIYRAIKKRLPSSLVEMEVSINDFPVDILIDKRICIEVDGPSHYLQPESNPDPKSRITPAEHGDSAVSVLPSLPGERRAKDRFVDHMLAQYGYRVFRIPYTCEPGSLEFQGIIDQIQTSLTDQE